ncbi:MAG: D-alanyl-D-alanine carboxypeptidase [Rhodobacteraceae bacterium]|nr:D-alanyl-D-alanine carboxypeptidase [Paracoccaceae bacterium]
MLRQVAQGFFLVLFFAFTGIAANAAPFAALVMDARTGEVLYARNADTRLHPASLTKMMTLYITFEAISRGEISLDTMVTVSKRAAAEPPSKLGLKAGQKIALRYLIRAAAVKSANDAATALGEAIEGSEAKFARRMNKTAKALGMSRTTFKNAHGLTESGHLSTARDMTNLGRHLFFDYPQYYNLFSRRSTDAGMKSVSNTNRKFLAAYRGADGIKTGYTQAAGFNLVASAQRGQERVIATVFGGRSTAARNEKVAELLDLGFSKAPTHVAVRKPDAPHYNDKPAVKALQVAAVATSPRPEPRRARSEDEADQLQKAIAVAVSVAEAEADGEIETEVEAVAVAEVDVDDVVIADANDALTGENSSAVMVAIRPEPRDDGPKVVTRVSTSGGRYWGIHLGAFPTRTAAEKVLLKTALQDLNTLDGALRKVVLQGGRYQANFVGMTEELAKRACSRLDAMRQKCTTLDPGS